MELLGKVVVAAFTISFLTFVALFGRLPAFRKTPIGFLHRLIWIHVPRFLAAVDSTITGGRVVRWGRRTNKYLFYENHPLVLILFLSLLIGCESVFLPAAWERLTLAHRVAAPIVIFFPYLSLYLSIVSKSFITRENHPQHLRTYPYDKVIFHPGTMCRTCQFLKPARSKHCSLCNACVARSDHHCIWLRTCVGQNNYQYFLALLLSTSVLLFYGAYLGYHILYDAVQEAFHTGPYGRYWSEGIRWVAYFELLAFAAGDNIRVGGVALFAMLTAPLSSAMFVYHLYLIWAGMTTNESGKWGDWRDDISYGAVFKAKASQIYPPPEDDPVAQPPIPWPITSDQTLVYTQGAEPPKIGSLLTMDRISIIQPENTETVAPDPRWARVKSLGDVTNIYDLGFWANLRDSLGLDRRR